jgi:hypothetical protein
MMRESRRHVHHRLGAGRLWTELGRSRPRLLEDDRAALRLATEHQVICEADHYFGVARKAPERHRTVGRAYLPIGSQFSADVGVNPL